ncbi:hypothetical protein D3P07_00660 [Paenibacillus sp. 1011MAR3C5]|uniref:hypothetical protein n=1 Tax=Paenibacillus sp. 1011MAR3C5 TaxID=1675787 RepID=UPI000E6C9562|nr:hypothetical protein [Paenibacillus sp. 1011MAR3C5]RJE90655.1 hypothetical protein D3P07_00660 [Paenibacillus sp. 1011MAR3C5]
MFILGNRSMTNSPVDFQDFSWIVEYSDGTHLAEFDFESKKPNNFYAIDKSKAIRFGLIGNNSQAYFDIGNGIFTVNNHRFTVSYEANNIEYPLTGRSLIYNDLITYKDAVSDASVFSRKNRGRFNDTITQYNFGYKKKMELLDVNIYYQCVLSLPINGTAFFQIKISSDKDLNGKLIFRRNGKIVDAIEAPLLQDMSGNMNWTLK